MKGSSDEGFSGPCTDHTRGDQRPGGGWRGEGARTDRYRLAGELAAPPPSPRSAIDTLQQQAAVDEDDAVVRRTGGTDVMAISEQDGKMRQLCTESALQATDTSEKTGGQRE